MEKIAGIKRVQVERQNNGQHKEQAANRRSPSPHAGLFGSHGTTPIPCPKSEHQQNASNAQDTNSRQQDSADREVFRKNGIGERSRSNGPEESFRIEPESGRGG